jgi:hypothetical protein
MSTGQLKRYATGDILLMEDEPYLNTWLPDVLREAGGVPLTAVPVGTWRCPSGSILCDEGMCGGCECCGDDSLFESPIVQGWEPECMTCGRKSLLVQPEGIFDFPIS